MATVHGHTHTHVRGGGGWRRAACSPVYIYIYIYASAVEASRSYALVRDANLFVWYCLFGARAYTLVDSSLLLGEEPPKCYGAVRTTSLNTGLGGLRAAHSFTCPGRTGKGVACTGKRRYKRRLLTCATHITVHRNCTWVSHCFFFYHQSLPPSIVWCHKLKPVLFGTPRSGAPVPNYHFTK